MKALIKNTLENRGTKGQQWLDALPHLVDQLAQKWCLTRLEPVKNLSYNYVLQACHHNTIPVVLKIGMKVEQEREALQFYQGKGCVRLLETDVAKGALLLEAIEPGITLKTLFPQNDEAAVAHTVQVMKQLHAVPLAQSSQFPPLDKHLESLFKTEKHVLPERHLEKAQALARTLLSSQAAPVMLHSDLHHENILLHESRGWIAIDPRGVMGEPAFEIGTFIYNPIPDLHAQKNASALMAARLNLFAQLLDIDLQRLKAWAYVQAVLSACWDLEGNGSSNYSLQCASLIEGL